MINICYSKQDIVKSVLITPDNREMEPNVVKIIVGIMKNYWLTAPADHVHLAMVVPQFKGALHAYVATVQEHKLQLVQTAKIVHLIRQHQRTKNARNLFVHHMVEKSSLKTVSVMNVNLMKELMNREEFVDQIPVMKNRC